MLHNYNQNSMRTLECDTLIIGGGIAGISRGNFNKIKATFMQHFRSTPKKTTSE